VAVDDDGSNERVINTEEVDLEAKCVIDDEEMPVEQDADVIAKAENAVVTSISTDGQNNGKSNNMGELFLTLY